MTPDQGGQSRDYPTAESPASKKCVAALYARVSKKEQNEAMQLYDLRAYVARMEWESVEYIEKESSVKRRPVFERLLRDAKAGKINVILVWRIDRWARS